MTKTVFRCESNPKKYCCPRCGIFYCSLDCYKSEKHIECSESFYKDCVNNELSSLNVDNESKQKMIDILSKISKQDVYDPEDFNDLRKVGYDGESIDSDDEADLSLEERIKDLNLDDPDALWKVLTTDEKNEFEALLSKGDFGSLIPQWEPWWMFSKTEKLVEDVDDKNDDEKNALMKCPQLLNVPPFSALTSVKPSPAIRNNISNVLASYAFIMRYFNGEVDPVESTAYLLSICGNLHNNVNYEDLATSVEAVAQMCLQSDLIETDISALDIMRRDTFLILQGPSEKNKLYYCKAALSHLHKILSDAKTKGTTTLRTNTIRTKKEKSEFSTKFPDRNREHLPKFDSNKVRKCMKKIEYYLSFVETHGMDFE
ncbi:unnamed protein product [Diatraea saccharalis]|uniref:HIT-type domain-containing protein n=1 Tax=Diatraea saccharalis TaxID=40085 RepID=A0A9P0C6N3_9NEOP|nr:unnamed protein product [Diatraea saccharalis]